MSLGIIVQTEGVFDGFLAMGWARDNVRSIEKYSKNAEIKRVFFKSIIGDMPGEWGAGWNKIDKAFGKPFISITLEDAEIGER